MLKAKVIVPAVVAALVLAGAASAASLDLIRGTDGPDNLNGTSGPDIIYARGGNDSIRAHDGNDVVYAGRGNDVARGGPGNDVVYGGAGNDVLWVGSGADVQYGGEGNDILHALANDNQPDIINCGPGYDVAYVIVHDPVRLHGCEQVIRLSPEEAAATAAANDDNG
jgi:Ca2+-binding RTX toxin-like protein